MRWVVTVIWGAALVWGAACSKDSSGGQMVQGFMPAPQPMGPLSGGGSDGPGTMAGMGSDRPPAAPTVGPMGDDPSLPASGMPDGSVDPAPAGPQPSSPMPDAAMADAGDEPPSNSTGPFPPVTDFEQNGPYTPTTVTMTGPGGGYTIYQPSELAPGGAKNPIVGWMSGGATTHTGYPLLPLLASHGFVVVAADVVPGIGQEAMLGQQIMDGLEWAIAEAQRQGSTYFDKLDTTKVASAGYSMGSLSTFMIADDPRLTTTVHISGGNMAPERVNNLRKPAAFICGTPGGAGCNILSGDCDIAAVNCDTDFSGATTPVFYANFAGGHLGILTPPLTGRINAMTVAWLRFRLMDDRSLSSRFVGPDCDYCMDPDWKVQQKQLDGI